MAFSWTSKNCVGDIEGSYVIYYLDVDMYMPPYGKGLGGRVKKKIGARRQYGKFYVLYIHR